MDRAMDYDDQFFNDRGYHEGSMMDEAEKDLDRETAADQLVKTRQVADEMMKGHKFYRSARISSLQLIHTEYSRRMIDYKDSPDYEHTEDMIAAGDAAEGAIKLRQLIYRCCLQEAANYLNFDLDKIEDTLRKS